MTVKVSVVVAVFNPGVLIDGLLSTVLGQSLGPDELELILTDDGSSDGSGERLARLPQEDARVHYTRIPNSGWPGRPRNVGLDLARGEYVLFMDQDDELFPESLERMHAYGLKHGADVVVGKEVRSGGRTPAPDLFRSNLPRADADDDLVLDLPTPHKLFRRSFLVEQGIGFPEGRRRLEDQHHLAQVCACSPVVSVLADYPCYRWIMRGDNNSQQLPDAQGYYDNLREVLDIFDSWPGGQDRRQRAYVRAYDGKVLARFGPGGFRRWPDDYRRGFFDAARAITLERFPEALDVLVAPAQQVRAAFLRAGDMEGLVRYSEGDSHVTTRPLVASSSWRRGTLTLSVSTRLEGKDGPVLFDRRGQRVLQRPSAVLPAAFDETGLDVTAALDVASADLVLVERTTNTEWFLPGEAVVGLVEQGGAWELQIDVQAQLNIGRALLGSPLVEGIWDLRLRLNALGYDSRPGVAVAPEQVPAPARAAGLDITPYRTRNGRLALQARGTPPDRTAASAPSLRRLRPELARLARRARRRIRRHRGTARG
jgi:glycosyltransferase involved in cell wall biosynthesis